MKYFSRTTIICCGFLMVLSALLFAIIAYVQKKPMDLDPNRIALVDKIGNNYIFRGNNPMLIENGKEVFAYDRLTEYLNDEIKKSGNEPITDYHLISYSLLGIVEQRLANIENDFFVSNPERGQVINESLISPPLLIEQFPKIPYLTSAIINLYNEKIMGMVERVHTIAAIQRDKPVVIYVHCYAGRDRTGLLVSYYNLLFSDYSLQKLRQLNVTQAGRHGKNLYDRAIQSYCSYLNKYYGKSQV